MARELLEPEGDNTPTYKERAEKTYLTLQRKIGNGQSGQHNFYFDKVEIEGLMGLLSHRFEGVY